MAFATLPYPSMDFVPLDVLTADELDQIVANINAVNGGIAGTSQIADDSISTAKIKNNAVSASKIDWDTLRSGTPVSLGFTASGGTFTATHFGYVVIECAVQSGAKISVSINSAETIVAQGGASAFEWIPIVIPVGKNDVITATSSDGGGNAQVMGGSSKFIPLH